MVVVAAADAAEKNNPFFKTNKWERNVGLTRAGRIKVTRLQAIAPHVESGPMVDALLSFVPLSPQHSFGIWMHMFPLASNYFLPYASARRWAENDMKECIHKSRYGRKHVPNWHVRQTGCSACICIHIQCIFSIPRKNTNDVGYMHRVSLQ